MKSYRGMTATEMVVTLVIVIVFAKMAIEVLQHFLPR